MPTKLLFKEQDEKLFWRYWQELLETTSAGPRYLPATPQSFSLISKNDGQLEADRSFVYLHDGRPLAAVYFPILRVEDQLVVSVPGDHLYSPMIADPRIEKALFAELDRIAGENKVAKIEMQLDPLDRTASFNYLQKYGYLECSILAYVLDLTVSDFLAGCRKGHRYEIKRMMADPDIEVFYADRENPAREVHDHYRRLHRKMAGRETRPPETFELQFEKLQAGQAVLFGVKYRGQVAALSYFDFIGTKANYASSAHDTDLPAMPFGHLLIYKAAEYLRKQGVRYVDTEQPGSPAAQFNYYPTDKQLNIALFKRGFAGSFVQNFRGVKYFSKAAWEKDVQTFQSQYLASSKQS